MPFTAIFAFLLHLVVAETSTFPTLPQGARQRIFYEGDVQGDRSSVVVSG
jgi:hypothetical protein